MGVKLGNNDISFKLGSGDCTVYLGETLIYSPTPPVPKWIATYTGGTTSSGACGSSSAITKGEIDGTDIVSVEIGDCVTTIGEKAFSGYTSLTSVTISDSVTSISGSAFNGCSGLTSVTIGSGVTSIGSYAFRNCSGLTSLTIYATTPPTLGTFTLAKTNDCPIYVPAASVSAYQSAWSDYASRIQAIPTPSPQWVTFNSGDDISGLDVYGVKGTASDLADTFPFTDQDISFDYHRTTVTVTIKENGVICYTNDYGPNDNVEIIFSNVGCSDYYTMPSSMTVTLLGTIQLYIYQ